MTHEEWSTEIRVALVRRNLTVSHFATELGISPEWLRATLYGRNIKSHVVAKASEALGVPNYLNEE